MHNLTLDVLTDLTVQMAVAWGVWTIGSMACGAVAALCCGRACDGVTSLYVSLWFPPRALRAAYDAVREQKKNNHGMCVC